MSYRAIQWATGNVGLHSLRAIIERPDFELVGLRTYDPKKVGIDAGVLAGLDPVGVLASDDEEELLALEADGVAYNALGTTLDDYTQPVNDIVKLLASGKNVVTSAVDYYLYPQLLIGLASKRDLDRLEESMSGWERVLLPGWRHARICHRSVAPDHDSHQPSNRSHRSDRARRLKYVYLVQRVAGLYGLCRIPRAARTVHEADDRRG